MISQTHTGSSLQLRTEKGAKLQPVAKLEFKQARNGINFYTGLTTDGQTIQVWPNNKRPDKKDPDLQVKIVTKSEVEGSKDVYTTVCGLWRSVSEKTGKKYYRGNKDGVGTYFMFLDDDNKSGNE